MKKTDIIGAVLTEVLAYDKGGGSMSLVAALADAAMPHLTMTCIYSRSHCIPHGHDFPCPYERIKELVGEGRG